MAKERRIRIKENRARSIAAGISIVVFIGLIVLMIALTGCGKQATATKDGNKVKESYKDIEENKESGIYVLNQDKTFSPILPDLPGYAGSTSKSSSDRYVWYTDNDTNVTNLIPTVTPSTPLVAIYNNTSDMPTDWYIERYKSKGYTVGMHISLADDKTMQIIPEDKLSGTSAASALKKISGDDDEYTINSISGASVLPIDNVDNNMMILLGFEKNKEYTFEFYQGTKLRRINMLADTRIFQSSQYIALKDPYKKTSKGYFIINLPINLQSGYYYLSDIGFFRYMEN